MNPRKKLLLIAICTTLSASLHAQLEVAQLLTKGRSATGLGANLHIGFPLPHGNEISTEAGLYYFAPDQSHEILFPLLLGFRHTFDHSGSGWYVDPFAGYTIGGTDIARTDAGGNVLYHPDGTEIDQKPSGPTAGLGVGYILPDPRLPINFGLRFTHVFVSGDPSPSVLALRISWSMFVARRKT